MAECGDCRYLSETDQVCKNKKSDCVGEVMSADDICDYFAELKTEAE